MPGGLPAIRITVGRLDFTQEAENITYSNADPGGFEMCTFDLEAERADKINPGDRIRIIDGFGIVWEGRVSEPAKNIKHGWHVNRRVGATTTRVSGEGYGAGTKDNDMSMVYIDQDLTRWEDPSTARQIDLINLNLSLQTTQVSANPNTGQPAIAMSITDAWAAPYLPVCESWYDAGPLNVVSYIAFQMSTNVAAGVGTWNIFMTYASNSENGFQPSSVNLYPGAGSDFVAAPPVRFALLDFENTVTPAGVAGANYYCFWQVAVYGNHGLALRYGPFGTLFPFGGFYTSDIATHAATLAIAAGANMKIGRVDVMSQYVVPHYVQYTPVNHEQIISDMAKLAPAHYGVWESSSIFDDLPEFTFRAYGTDADYFCSMADCDEADLSERLANLYTEAIITYEDAAGTEYAITVSLPNAILGINGIQRTDVLDLGLSDAASAYVFASFVLQALYAQARSAGTVTLTGKVRDHNGAPYPAYRLRAGIHRLRVSDTPVRMGMFQSSDKDSFRISRVECNADTTSGTITARIELDAGPNLIETLTSRLNIASILAGQGG